MYIMAYFTDEEQALFLAQSEDFFHWVPCNGEKPVLDVRQEGKRIRDPYLFQDQQGLFHLLFTDDWQSRTIGYSRSTDCRSWETPTYLSLFGQTEDVHNCWAPECFYDPAEKRYTLIWSTSFCAQNSEHEESNRIYCSHTTDFQTFSTPQLFFDPGYVVIDATVCVTKQGYWMAFKDERGFNAPGTPYSAIRTAVSQKLPQFDLPSPLLTPHCSEGPLLLREQESIWLFYDCFREKRYGVLQSRDFVHWQEVGEQFTFPRGCKHFSIIKCNQPFA